MSPRLKVLAAACGAALTLGACGEGGGAVARAEFPAERTEDGVRVGSVESADPDATIGMVLAARFTESGEHVVVLDFAPPYVKVFRRDGTLERAFLTAGGGPREMRHPAALAVAGDSLILVADGRRVAVFGMDGQLRAEGRIGFPVLAAAMGCDGEWIAYGPGTAAGGRISWLHLVRSGAEGMRSSDLEFREALGAETIGMGVAYGIARAADTVRVWHVLGAAPAVLGWRCGQARPDTWAVRPLDQRGESPRRRGDAVRMTIEPGARSLAGMAAVPGGVVLAAHVVPAPGDSATTDRRRGGSGRSPWPATTCCATAIRGTACSSARPTRRRACSPSPRTTCAASSRSRNTDFPSSLCAQTVDDLTRRRGGHGELRRSGQPFPRLSLLLRGSA
jgi:hypothetical protein